MTGESGFRMDANERVDAVLGEAVRPGTIDTGAEHRAVAAFRSARDEGGHRARTRRRDDWRPSARSRALVSLRAAVGAVLASLLLGGGALATMNTSRTLDGGTPPTADHRPPPQTTPSPPPPAERRTPPPLPRPKQTRTHPEAPNETKPKAKAKDEGGTKAKDEGGAKAKDESGAKAKDEAKGKDEGGAKSEAKAKSKPAQPKPPKKKTNKPR